MSKPARPTSDANRGLLQSGLIVALGVGGGSALHSVFHLALARILGPSEYSLLASLLAFILIATPPTLAVQAALAREMAWRLHHEGEAAAGAVLRATTSALLRRLVAVGALAVIPGVLAIVILDVRDPVAVLTTMISIVGMFSLSLIWGGLQGIERFEVLSAGQFGFAALKLLVGCLIGLATEDAGLVMLGVVAGAALTTFASVPSLRAVWTTGASLPAHPRRILRGFAGGPAVVLTLFAVISGLDILVARIALDPDTAGAYSAVSFGARTMLVVPLAVTTVLLPRVAKIADAQIQRRLLLIGLAVVGVIGALATAVLFLIPETVIRIAFGSEYLQAESWFGPLAGVMTLFGLANVYSFHLLSINEDRFAFVMAAIAAAQLPFYAIFHDTPEDLIWVMGSSAAVLLIASELFERGLRRSGSIDPAAATPRYRPTVPPERPPSLERYDGLVSVVIPAYNEGDRIERSIAETSETLTGLGCRFELVIVDDGSTDRTRELAGAAASRSERAVRVIGLDENRGKGAAIVEGARKSRGDLVLFLDADLEVHPRQLTLLYERMATGEADVVIGSKLDPGSTVDYPFKRSLISWTYYALIRTFFGLPVRDTQTGLKLFRREVLDAVLPRMLVKRYGYDLESLVIAQRRGFVIREAPVVVTKEREHPRIGWREVFYTGRDTAAVWYRTYLRRYYDRPIQAAVRSNPSESKLGTGDGKP